ncbi:MAG: LuxR family transcriptional regulator, partial [Muribaculaceae bacterium]|nr:LuxR family transcriptional regulator [Muribaculaceae bacterium]
MVLRNCEFFCFEDEVWVRMADGQTSKVTEKDVDLVREVDELISTFYPDAYKMLKEMYKSSASNILYQRFRIVSRFIRCNLSNLDHVPDVSHDRMMVLESVQCPMRGECRYDGII